MKSKTSDPLRHFSILASVAFGLLVFFAATAGADQGGIKLRPKKVFAGVGELELPAAVVVAPDGSGRQFLVLQGGKIVILPADQSAVELETFLDLSGRKLIAHKFEEGLLGLAFHPEFGSNGKFYVYHTLQEPKRSRVVEFSVEADDRDAVDLDSERVLLEIPQPFWNHNSGNLLFGPDGYLYIGVGDGGKGGDPLQFGQNPFVLNGTILRIDVDTRFGELEYGIPADNPFMKEGGEVKPGTRGEVYAFGMRNPWGLSFDRDGRLWCADVGQQLWEEVNLIENGGNYGWSVREGKDPFPASLGKPVEGVEFIDPIHQYGRTEGISITGGFVYEGEKIPALRGAYVFGDWGTGRIWAIRHDGAKGEVSEVLELFRHDKKDKDLLFQPTAITPSPEGEIQVATWKGGIFLMEEAK